MNLRALWILGFAVATLGSWINVAHALDAYVHACTSAPTNPATRYAGCVSQSWSRPDANDVVLTGSSWDAADARWVRFGDLTDAAQVEACWNGASEGGAIGSCVPGAAGFVAKSTLVVSQPAPSPAPSPAPTPVPTTALVDWTVSWTRPLTNTDGTPIDDILTYELDRGTSPNGPWTIAWTGSALTATVQAPVGTQYFTVSAISAGGRSAPTNLVSATQTAPTSGSPPAPPVIVGAQPRALALVMGTSAGTRAVYARTSTGSRGIKLGDLTVGPVNGDFDRVECLPADNFTYGGNRYARVTAQGLDGYVTGCYAVGTH